MSDFGDLVSIAVKWLKCECEYNGFTLNVLLVALRLVAFQSCYDVWNWLNELEYKKNELFKIECFQNK